MRVKCPIIYKTTNLIDNKIYIGQSIYDNKNYLGSGLHISRAINLYGKENFKKEILEYCDHKILNDREVYWITVFNSTNLDIGYNIESGGNQNYIVSESTKKKLRAARATQIRKPCSIETRKKISDAQINVPKSEEYKRKMSESKKGSIPWNKGKKGVSEETSEKMAKAKLNVPRKDSTKNKISVASSKMWKEAFINDIDKITRMSHKGTVRTERKLK